jgi:phosphatidate cytidylyltransferase
MLLSNPLAHPFLAPLSWPLLGIFSSSLVALLFAVRGRLGQLRSSVLFRRWRTWLLIAPIFSLVVLSGGLAVALFAAALAVQGAREYGRLCVLPPWDHAVLLTAAALAPLAALWLPLHWLLLLPLFATLPALLSQDVEHGVGRIARLGFGLWYLPINLALFTRLDPGVLLGVGLAVALSDVGAFTLGRRLKGPRMAARLSPAKTWAGAAGNILGAALGFQLLSALMPGAPLLPLTLVVALGAIWGDLLESLVKRTAGAKDSGTWLSGFGGLLDRIDSLLVVLPLTYLLLEVTS